MTPNHSPFVEMQDIPLEPGDIAAHCPQTKVVGVVAKNVEVRPWRAEFPVCRALKQYQILHLGIQKARAPFRIVRSKATTTLFLACIGGRGKVLLDGSWRICREGMACLLPPGNLNVVKAIS